MPGQGFQIYLFFGLEGARITQVVMNSVLKEGDFKCTQKS